VIAAWAVALIAVAAALGLAHRRACEREVAVRTAHELRGPLQALALGLAIECRHGAQTQRWRGIELELTRARLALEDLAEGRSPTGKPPVLERVDARVLLQDAADAAQSRGAPITIEWEGEAAAVWCARVRIAQALGNLIANAIEHGGGPVALRGRVSAGTVRFEVSDQGPGLPAPVAVLTRSARRGKGTRGRGLAIAIEVAASHGGRLAAAPSARGARLVLELPGANRSQALYPRGCPTVR
jgi:signal transduction histidine kinase